MGKAFSLFLFQWIAAEEDGFARKLFRRVDEGAGIAEGVCQNGQLRTGEDEVVRPALAQAVKQAAPILRLGRERF